MMLVYQIDAAGYSTGQSREIAEADGVGIGWITTAPPAVDEGEYAKWDGSWAVTTTPPGPSLDSLRAAKFAALAERRWQAETGGMVVGGVPIKTDRESTGLITPAYVKADKDAGFTARWKVDTGVFVTLDAATLITIGDAVTAHVQACFDNEGALTTAILAAADQAALDAIDIEAGWPS